MMKKLLFILSITFIVCSYSCKTNNNSKESKEKIIELNKKIDSLINENKHLKALVKKADNYIKVMEY